MDIHVRELMRDLGNSSNLIEFKQLLEDFKIKLPNNILIEALRSFLNTPEHEFYGKDGDNPAYFELYLRTLIAVLERVCYTSFVLKQSFHDQLYAKLKDFVERHYRMTHVFTHGIYGLSDEFQHNTINIESRRFPNYNINFLLIHLRDTLHSLNNDEPCSTEILDRAKKILNLLTSLTVTVAHSGPQLTVVAEIFFKSMGEIFSFKYPIAKWYSKWRELLFIRYLIEISNQELSTDKLRHFKEISLLDLISQHILNQISEQGTLTIEKISEYLHNKKEFLNLITKKEPIAPPYSLWERGLFGELVKNEIDAYKESLQINLRQEFEGLKNTVVLKLKEANLVNEKISEETQEQLSYKEAQKTLKNIIKKNSTDENLLKCGLGHNISYISINNWKIPTGCPFCKTKINPELIYDLKLNSMLKNLYERLTTYFGTSMKEHRISIRIKNFYPVFMMFILSPYKKTIYKQNYSDALGWLKQMLKFKPKSYTIRCVMAIIYWKIGLKEKDQKIASQNHSKALNILTEAIRLWPKKSLAYMYRSQIYMFFQNNYCASMDLNEVLSNNPNNTIALLYKAKIYVDEGEFDYARQEFEKINAKNSGQSILSTLLPKLNRPNKWMLFGPEKSLPVQLYSLDSFTVIAYVLFKIWRSLYRPKGRKYIKELELAISNCRQAIENNCRNIVALAIRGNSNFNKKFFNDAFNDFNEILKILPNNQIVLIWRGKTNRFLGKNQESLEDLNNAIHQSNTTSNESELHSHFNNIFGIRKNQLSSLLRHRGNTYRMLDKYEKSLDDFNESLTIKPGDAIILRNRGETYRVMGRLEEALEDFNKSLNMRQNNKFALKNRSAVYCMMKDYDNALKDLNKLLEVDQDDETALKSREEIYRDILNWQIWILRRQWVILKWQVWILRRQ
ncbi:hypothetical protein C2G38_2139167 [Gigaspora rosea]|uniref:Uncharacterized protein n=1 Tax=Gigaspora rosea TaxID=44941 RepID=A0A397VXF6_9GLOM|nr:hypothetical protein C2G38_2139167 [Gigaspora rosea]